MEDFLIHKTELSAKDWAIDAAIAAAAFAFGCVQLMVSVSLIFPDEMMRYMLGIEAVVPSGVGYAALALTTLPLVARRKSPWIVFVFVFVAFLASQELFRGVTLAAIGPMVALATIAYECSRTEAIVAVALSIVGLLLVPRGNAAWAMWFWSFVQDAALMAAAALAGYAVRSHRDYLRAVEQRAEEAERTKEQLAARRVEEERVRIAREVHDITAHSLSAVSIQTAAAERLIDRDPAAAKEAVATARKTAKDALEEIRSMIGVLRSGEDPAETTPTDGTDRLGDLVVFLRDAGVGATLDASAYDRSKIPAYIDIALFGIAREAATNIVRHAQARTASISLSSTDAQALLTVENDGAPVSPAALAEAEGHGVVGMRERARLLGGTLEAAPRASGGFRVSASIPVAGQQQDAKEL